MAIYTFFAVSAPFKTIKEVRERVKDVAKQMKKVWSC